MRRLEKFERRLAALDAVLRGWEAARDRQQKRRAHDETLAAILRAGLECAGLDPNQSPCFRRLENPDLLPAFLRPRPFVHPLRRLAERQRPRSLLEILDEQTKHYQQGRPPNLGNASVMQLIGYYCFGDGCVHDDTPEAPA